MTPLNMRNEKNFAMRQEDGTFYWQRGRGTRAANLLRIQPLRGNRKTEVAMKRAETCRGESERGRESRLWLSTVRAQSRRHDARAQRHADVFTFSIFRYTHRLRRGFAR